jgi:TonB family protein
MHIQALGRPVSQDALPEGDFSYPIKKSGAALLFKIVIALAVLGGGFFAVTQLMAPGEPTKTASVTPPPVEPPPPAPAPVAAVIVDAQQATPEPVTTETPPATNAAPTNPPPTDTPPPANPPPTDTPPPTTHKRTPKVTTKPTNDKPTTDAGTKPATESTEQTASGECDEVSCIMTKYERACCLRYKPTDGFTPKNVIPDSLDKAMVRAGVETVKPKIVACGEQNGAKGTVKVAVTVDDAGKVTAVSVIESPDTALGECVAGAMRKARFGKSVNGSEFNYPFVF